MQGGSGTLPFFFGPIEKLPQAGDDQKTTEQFFQKVQVQQGSKKGKQLGTALVDAFPVLGTGTVLLPWSLLCFLQQDSARAIGLLGIYTTVTLTRSLMEPKLVGRHLGLDPLATLMSLYIGYRLWGIPGMLFAPLLAVTALQLVPEKR